MARIPLILLLTCLFFTEIVVAQSDTQAQNILFGAYRKYKTYQNIKINFTTITENKPRGVYKTQQGTAFVKGMHHVILLDDREIITDGNTIWTYVKSQKKVFISTYDPNDGKITPDEIFREDFLRRGLTYKYIDEQGDNNQSSMLPTIRPEDIIEFSPTKNNRNYLKFRLFIDRESHLVNHWKVFLKNGGTIDYQMDITPNTPVADNFFTYSSYRFPAATETIDLRRH